MRLYIEYSIIYFYNNKYINNALNLYGIGFSIIMNSENIMFTLCSVTVSRTVTYMFIKTSSLIMNVLISNKGTQILNIAM